MRECKRGSSKGHTALLILLAMLFCCSCGPSENKAPQTTGKNPGSEKKEHVIAFVTNQVADFWNLAEAGCQDAAKDLSDDGQTVSVKVRFPNPGTTTQQKQEVEDLIAAGAQGLAISPLSADDMVPLLDQWASRMPLLTHDSDSPNSQRLCYIGMDNYKAGRMVGELVKQAIPAGGKVALFIGRLEQDNSQLRRQGVIDVLMGVPQRGETFADVDAELKNDKFEIVATYLDQGKPEIALSKAEDALSKYNDLAALVGLFEYDPPELYKAVEKRGKLGEIAIVGFDENDLTLQGIKDGHIIGTVVQNPYQYGYQSVKILTSILNGDPSAIPENKYIEIEPRQITKANLDAFWDAKKSQLAR